MEQVASQYRDVEVKEVSLTDQPERFAELQVMSTPAIAVNGKLEFVGVPKEVHLRAKIEAALGPA